MEPDVLGPPYERQTIDLGADDEGPVVATLVRRRAERPTGRAVLYVHGFVDYFFQTHLADFFAERGWDFYALDLRKYGRSLLPGQTPNFCHDISDYFPELDAAAEIIRKDDGHETLLAMGHSTGAPTYPGGSSVVISTASPSRTTRSIATSSGRDPSSRTPWASTKAEPASAPRRATTSGPAAIPAGTGWTRHRQPPSPAYRCRPAVGNTATPSPPKRAQPGTISASDTTSGATPAGSVTLDRRPNSPPEAPTRSAAVNNDSPTGSSPLRKKNAVPKPPDDRYGRMARPTTWHSS
ncbi:alpha/beta fold hydrolase [Micromonospora sp. M51]|uniref:alpha/beta fold hydrolase n=1 Tax=Micromonospora sp. M51 TaxID=2824889 RepID=UPI002810A7B2|nr:alpha/beta fold hydrolase [Micromonospora sp. M51]